MTHQVSVLIPLYRSARWESVILANIARARAGGAEVILGDRHGDDDLAERLAIAYRNDSAVQVLRSNDRSDFVDNSNALLRAAQGRYARIVPHDDDMLETDAMVAALEAQRGAVLCYGRLPGLDGDGRANPARDERQEYETTAQGFWSLQDALSVFWTRRVQGGFKGLVRVDALHKRDLWIRKAEGVAYSERCWIAGLGMAGPISCVASDMLAKRFYPESTHPAWRRDDACIAACATVLAGYARDLIADAELAQAAVKDIYFNALRWRRLGVVEGVNSYRPAPVSAELRRRLSVALS